MTYGRAVAVCFAGYWRYLSQVSELANSYIAPEESAKAEARGMWAGEFIKPERRRRGERLAVCE
jgi:hypothetical protein